MSDQECPYCEDCEIIQVDNEGNELPREGVACELEFESPEYKCKTHGNLFYEWELP